MRAELPVEADKYTRDNSISLVFREQVARYPGSTAVLFGEQALTYEELDRRSNQFARYLRSRGVVREALVAICLERCLELPVALLGTLKAGGAYVPIDPSYPKERIDFILADTAAAVIVTTKDLAAKLFSVVDGARRSIIVTSEETVNESESELQCDCTGASLAYVMYTSGSTGVPKGVLIEHRAVVRLVKDTNYAELNRDQVFLQLSPVSFDASTFEIWGPLLNGGRLALFAPGTPTLDAIGAAISRYGVTTLWLTAGLFHRMAEQRPKDFGPLQQLLAGGDVLSSVHIRKVLGECPGLTVINGYGPTESTTFAACYRMQEQALVPERVPIGWSISHTTIYLLDEESHPAAEGEIVIGGDGVARGYLNQAALTKTRFIDDASSSAGARLYRTGDRGRYRSDGALEFLGRRDRQVKVSGYRVEPSEIEHVLRQHPRVLDAAVVVSNQAQGEKKLHAYVATPVQDRAVEREIREYLTRRLPSYLVPSTIEPVSDLPLTSNGKLDRQALVQSSSCSEPESEQGTGSLEQRILEIWRKVLGVPHVPVAANFFELGGDSLQLITVHSYLHRAGLGDVSLTDLFAYPTVSQLAAFIERPAAEQSVSSEFEERAAQRKSMQNRAKASRAEAGDLRAN